MGLPTTKEAVRKFWLTWNKGISCSEEAKRKTALTKKLNPYKHSEETKRKMSATRFAKKFKHSEETKRKIGLKHKNKKISEETRKKISVSNTGFRHSEETKRKISKKLNGHAVSISTRLKIGAANRGNPGICGDRNPSKRLDVRKKIGDKKRGYKYSEEAKRNMSLGHIGIIPSIETRLKMSESRIKNMISDSYKKKFKYKETYMRSSWEVMTAKWLDNNGIKWGYETTKCAFKLKNKHTYLIDFYLPELNKYIEVKGRWFGTSQKRFLEAQHYLDLCIIDKRNIDNIDLNTYSIIQNT